jgi:hypothetical protein
MEILEASVICKVNKKEIQFRQEKNGTSPTLQIPR